MAKEVNRWIIIMRMIKIIIIIVIIVMIILANLSA